MLKAKRIMKDEALCTAFTGIPLTTFLSIVFYCHLLKLSLRSGIIVWSLQIVLVALLSHPLHCWMYEEFFLSVYMWAWMYNMYSSWWRNSVLKLRLCSFLLCRILFLCFVLFHFDLYASPLGLVMLSHSSHLFSRSRLQANYYVCCSLLTFIVPEY